MVFLNRIRYTVKPLNFAGDLIALISHVMKIRKIKYPRRFKFYIASNCKASRFAKLSTSRSGSNFQFMKLSPHEIKVLYSILYMFDLLSDSTKVKSNLKCAQISAYLKFVV